MVALIAPAVLDKVEMMYKVQQSSGDWKVTYLADKLFF